MAKKGSAGDYEVGYGRPPKHTRFVPGQSGNKKGRPKRKRDAAQLAEAALNRKVTVVENGVRTKMTVENIAYRKLADRALSGDSKALGFLLNLAKERRDLAEPAADKTAVSQSDREIIENFLARQKLGIRS